jgi:hypothetical protein
MSNNAASSSSSTDITNSSSNAANNPQAGQGRPLPKKEADIFKNVIKFYESKQYKKGLKNADAILKRYPNHGETLCMKGLIVNAMAVSELSLWGAPPETKKQGGGDAQQQQQQQQQQTVSDKKKEAVELVKRGLMMDMR